MCEQVLLIISAEVKLQLNKQVELKIDVAQLPVAYINMIIRNCFSLLVRRNRRQRQPTKAIKFFTNRHPLKKRSGNLHALHNESIDVAKYTASFEHKMYKPRSIQHRLSASING